MRHHSYAPQVGYRGKFSSPAIDDFVFEEWAALAAQDTAAFEVRRRVMIHEFLQASGKHRENLTHLQREIDAVRARAPLPHESLFLITRMLSDHLAFLQEQLAALNQLLPRPEAS